MLEQSRFVCFFLSSAFYFSVDALNGNVFLCAGLSRSGKTGRHNISCVRFQSRFLKDDAARGLGLVSERKR